MILRIVKVENVEGAEAVRFACCPDERLWGEYNWSTRWDPEGHSRFLSAKLLLASVACE